MDFKDYLSVAKSIAAQPFITLTDEDVDLIEKQLRLESKFSKDAEKEVLLTFIEALRNHRDGLAFLEANPNISTILFDKPKKLNKSARIQVKNYDPVRIKKFFETCLLAKLLETVGAELQTKKYLRLFHLVKYNRFLPETVVLEIIKGLNSRLDFIQTKLKARLESSSQDVHELKTIIIYLGNQPLKARWNRMNIEAINVLFADDETGGSTINWISNYFEALGQTPNTEFEREKRGELLKGCNCAMIFIVSMFVFFGIVILIVMSTHESSNTTLKETPQKLLNNAVTSLPAELANFQVNDQTTLIDLKRPETNSGKLGAEFIHGQMPPFALDALLVNATTSDMIIFSTSRTKPLSYLEATSRFIRAGDSIKWSSYLGTHLYIGTNQKLVQQKSIGMHVARFRFLDMKTSARELVKKEFRFKGRLTVRDSLGFFSFDYSSLNYPSKEKL